MTLNDFELAEAIIIGQNPGTNHPRMMTTLQSARERLQDRFDQPTAGTRIDPLQAPQEVSGTIGNGTKLSDLFCQCGSGAISRF